MSSSIPTDAETVQRTLRLMREPLAGFVRESIAKAVEEDLADESTIDGVVAQIGYGKPTAELDTRILLKLMERVWNPVFWNKPGKPGRSYAAELLFFANALFHQEDQKTFDKVRFVDTAMRLLNECGVGLPDELRSLHDALCGSKPPLKAVPEVETEGKGATGVEDLEDLIRDRTTILTGHLADIGAAVDRGNEILAELLERGRKKTSEQGPSETQEACTEPQAKAIYRLLLELRVNTSDNDDVGDALDDPRFDGSLIKTWCQQRYTKLEAGEKIKALKRKVERVSESPKHRQDRRR